MQVAIKFLERGPGISKSVLREILNHRLCVVHPNIVQFKEVCCRGCRPGFSLELLPFSGREPCCPEELTNGDVVGGHWFGGSEQ